MLLQIGMDSDLTVGESATTGLPILGQHFLMLSLILEMFLHGNTLKTSHLAIHNVIVCVTLVSLFTLQLTYFLMFLKSCLLQLPRHECQKPDQNSYSVSKNFSLSVHLQLTHLSHVKKPVSGQLSQVCGHIMITSLRFFNV